MLITENDRYTQATEYCDPACWFSMRPVYDHFGIRNIPIANKKPILNGWQHRQYGERAEAVVRDISPTAQVGILMQLNDLAVIDVDFDDGVIFHKILETFGHTPVIVQTKRGFHFYYRHRFGVVGRKWDGIDLKAGSAFVVSPLTEIHKNGRLIGRYDFISPEFEWLNDNQKISYFIKLIEKRLLPFIGETDCDVLAMA